MLSIAENMQQKIEKMQEELMKVQLKYQKELEKLERENKELRKQLLLKGQNGSAYRKIKVRFSLPRLVLEGTIPE